MSTKAVAYEKSLTPVIDGRTQYAVNIGIFPMRIRMMTRFNYDPAFLVHFYAVVCQQADLHGAHEVRFLITENFIGDRLNWRWNVRGRGERTFSFFYA